MNPSILLVLLVLGATALVATDTSHRIPTLEEEIARFAAIREQTARSGGCTLDLRIPSLGCQ